jgi:peptide/nickel transport system permease protein
VSMPSPQGGLSLPIGEEEAHEIGGHPEKLESGGRFWARFLKTRSAVIALGFIVVLVFCAVFAKWVSPYPPNKIFPDFNTGPSSAHWLGTDSVGRDILSRIIAGARVSLQAAFQIVILALIAAVPIGLIAGYFGGWRDGVLMRIMDAMFAFPPLILALAVASLLGKSLFNESLAIAVVFVPSFVRLIRGQVLAIREETFMEASRSLGASDGRMIRKHVLPNVASPLIVQVALALGYGLLAEAGLSFLGLGVQPPQASWGGMLSDAYNYIFSDPWGLIPPGVAIAVTVLSFNLIADGLRDALGRERFREEK